jgi:two-component system, cell cycle response regulator
MSRPTMGDIAERRTALRSRSHARDLLPSTRGGPFAAVALVGVAVHALASAAGIGRGPLVEDWLYCALYGLAAVACVAHARTPGPARAGWIMAAIGIAFWGGSEVAFRILAPDPADWYPRLSQLLLAIAFTCAYTTLVLLARSRVKRFDAVLALDGAVAALAMTAVAALFLFPDRTSEGPELPAAFLLAALAGLAFVLAVHALCAWRPDRLWELITLAIAVNVVGDIVLVNAAAEDEFRRGSVADTLFVSSALLLAFAGFHAGRRGHGLLGRPLGLPGPLGFATVAICVLVVAAVAGVAVLPIVLAGLALAATLVRMAFALKLLERSTHEAMTDGLTDLGNRRKLMQDLERELSESNGRPLTLALFDLDGFKAYNDTFGHPSGDALLALCADRLAVAVRPGRAYRMGGDEFCALLEGGIAASYKALQRGRAALQESGHGFSVTTSYGAVALHEEATDVSTALRLADARMYEVKAMGKVVEHHQTRDALLQALKEREPGVRDRAVDVSALAVGVAGRLELDPAGIAAVARAAELHDIGKMAVPDAILGKNGALDADEWRVVRQHTIVGERILRAAPSLSNAAPLVRWSHERWDGTGYPDGLPGEEVPVGARIIAACDAYTAMISTRPHAGPRTSEEALVELRRCAGSQFDPAVVEALAEEVTAASAGLD